MEQPILTDAEMESLNQIRRTHECPVRCSKEDPPAVLAEMAGIRQRHRGELLGMVDKLLAGVDKLKRGVAWENAHHFADMVDHLSAENAKLKAEAGDRAMLIATNHRLEQENAKLKEAKAELQCRHQALRADVEGMNRAQCNMQAKLDAMEDNLDHALNELAQANGRNSETRTIKHSDLSRFVVEIKPEYYQAEFKPGLGTMVTHVPNETMSLADLVKRYNQIAAAMADNSEG